MSSSSKNNKTKKLSTNPFSSDFDESVLQNEEGTTTLDTSHRSSNSNTRRLAPLDFTLQSYDKPGAPALDFDRFQQQENAFVSPLEEALQYDDAQTITSDLTTTRDEGIPRIIKKENKRFSTGTPKGDEMAPLLGGNSRQRRSSYSSSSSPSSNKNAGGTADGTSTESPVLKELDASQSEQEFAIDYKVIRLEDIGTASSWTILLLPYIAFFICVVLESSSNLKIASYGPIRAQSPCFATTNEDNNNKHEISFSHLKKAQILTPAFAPCYYDFIMNDTTTLSSSSSSSGGGSSSSSSSRAYIDPSSYNPKSNNNSSTNKDMLVVTTSGTVFESGHISNVPTSSSFMYGDAIFYGLSTKAVALIARGLVTSSVMILQRTGDGSATKTHDDWKILSKVKPKKLNAVCRLQQKQEENDNGREEENNKQQEQKVAPMPTWTCSSPRIVDVLFSMPGTSIISGDDMRVNVIFSLSDNFYNASVTTATNNNSTDVTFFSLDEKKAYDVFFSSVLLKNQQQASPVDLQLVNEIVSSSSYIIEYSNPLSEKIDRIIRLTSLGITFIFTIYWLYMFGAKGFRSCFCCCWGRKSKADGIENALMWWESPWIQFPERYYILLLLFSLFLIQGPLPIIMHFFPNLKRNPRAHASAEVMLSVGTNGILFVYLCLFQGFRYHTATVARKSMNHQRKVLDLRRAAKYVVESQKEGGSEVVMDTERSISRYIDEYFERHGDTDGTTSTEHLRLRHDPFGDSWADFLLPKICIFVVGIVSSLITACMKFPGTDSPPGRQANFNTIFVTTSFVQFFVALLWMVLIVKSVIVTGERLRVEPFLSTRPAQLAYRILFAHATLGFGAVCVSIVADIVRLIHKWEVGTGNDNEDISISALDLLSRVIAQLRQQFPYNANAASIDFGRIVFTTITVLITAFIFLPPRVHETNDNSSDDILNQQVADQSGIYSGSNIIERNVERQRRDKRHVVTLAKSTHTWRVFPLAIKRTRGLSNVICDQSFANNYHAIIALGSYVPVFCVETACWLNEASFQAYYSSTVKAWNDWVPGKMNLASIGLKLESAILDEGTSTQAYIATNMFPQVDGEADSIIVIAFRGSVDTVNMKTDFKSRQVPLLDQVIGIGTPFFKVTPDRVIIDDNGGWVWGTETTDEVEPVKVKCFSPTSSGAADCSHFHWEHIAAESSFIPVQQGAKAILSATPIARDTVPLVHEGFQEVYTHLRRKVIENFLPVLRRQLEKAVHAKESFHAIGETNLLPKIYITGHSLGGSLAQLLALDLASNLDIVLETKSNDDSLSERRRPEIDIFELPSNTSLDDLPPMKLSKRSASLNEGKENTISLQPAICVYTFGQPRVGNRAFSRFYKKRVPHTFRVTNEGDPITSMPNVVFCSGFYKHAGLEVVLDEGKTGNTLVGPTVVETLFRFHKVRANIAAHSTNQYRDCLESALGEHELQEYYKGHSGGDPEAGGGYGVVHKKNQSVPDWMTSGRKSTGATNM